MVITNQTRNDGFGAQYQTIIFTILYAEFHNLKFVYTPFTKMEHNYNDDLDFIEKKENLINIRENFDLMDENHKADLISVGLDQIYSFVEGNLDLCLNSSSFKKIKECFKKNKQNKPTNEISMHIRRPNKFDIGDYGYETDEYYLNVITEIKQKFNIENKVKIYSQGNINDFEKFHTDIYEFHLNESIEETFTNMVFSDILVMSKGSFSYTAALLNDGLVYYLPFWHKPRKSWLSI